MPEMIQANCNIPKCLASPKSENYPNAAKMSEIIQVDVESDRNITAT